MTKWALSHTGPCICLSSGLCFIKDRKPEGITLDILHQAIKDHPNSIFYRFKIPRIVKLGEALQIDNLSELGTLQDRFTTINIQTISRKRIFKRWPKNGGQLMENVYDSLPMEVRE